MNDRGEPVSIPPRPKSDVFDLRNLVRDLWRWKIMIIIFTAIGAIVGVRDVINFVPIYTAKMTVAPTMEDRISYPGTGGSGLLGAARNFGLIGDNAGSSRATSFDHFKHSLGSRDLANMLQARHGILKKIYSGSWDETNKKWIKPKIDESSFRQRIKTALHFNSPRSPDTESLAAYIGGMVNVNKVRLLGGSPFYMITVKHSDRDFALYLLKTVTKEADELVGARDRERQKKNKRYLEAQLGKANLAEVRSALLALLMQQVQKSMLLNSEPPYAVKIIEAPWVSTQPNQPRLWVIIGVPAAFALALILVIATMVISFRME